MRKPVIIGCQHDRWPVRRRKRALSSAWQDGAVGIGYRAWGIGGSMWIGAEEDESVRALNRAIELGVNLIDTARGYGESERIVGQVIRGHHGDPLYVATKVPPKNRIWPA